MCIVCNNELIFQGISILLPLSKYCGNSDQIFIIEVNGGSWTNKLLMLYDIRYRIARNKNWIFILIV